MTDDPTSGAGKPDVVPESVPGFTAVTVTALQAAGYLVQADWEQETFDVLPRTDDGTAVSGVILHPSHSVALYAVWDGFVPFDARTTVAEWSVRANTDLSTCAIEFSLDTGILAIRGVVHLGPLAVGTPGEDIPEESLSISRKAYASMLESCVTDVAETFKRLQQPVAELISGS